MTVAEILAQVWRNLGEPSDLDPYTGAVVDTGTAGGAILLRWLNEAIKEIVAWKFPNGDQIRFSQLESEAYFKTALVEGTAGCIASVDTDTGVVTLSASGFTPSAEDDFYNGWVIRISGGTGSGQVRLITDYDGSGTAATPHKVWDTDPDGTSTVELYKNFMEFVAATSSKATYNIPLDPTTVILASLKLINLDSGTELAFAERRESFAASFTDATSDPGSFYLYGNKIIFDSAVNTAVWFKLEYMKLPSDLTAGTDTPVIPAQWHSALVLATTWWGLSENGETGEAYATRRALETKMGMTKQELDMSFERSDGQMEVVL